MTKTPEELAEEYAKTDGPYAPLNANSKWLKDAFLAGYRAGTKGWISVKDRLPDRKQGWVVVYGTVRNSKWVVAPGGYEVDRKEWLCTYVYYKATTDSNGVITNEIAHMPFKEVTHWMPLPNRPEEDNG
jgi:hypothetical protein